MAKREITVYGIYNPTKKGNHLQHCYSTLKKKKSIHDIRVSVVVQRELKQVHIKLQKKKKSMKNH